MSRISPNALRTTFTGSGRITRQTTASTAGSMYGVSHCQRVPCSASPTMKASSSALVMQADITQPCTSRRTKSERILRLARASTTATTRQMARVTAA